MTKHLIYLKKLPVMDGLIGGMMQMMIQNKKNLLVLLLHLLHRRDLRRHLWLQRLQKALWVCLQFDVLNLMPVFALLEFLEPQLQAKFKVRSTSSPWPTASSWVS